MSIRKTLKGFIIFLNIIHIYIIIISIFYNNLIITQADKSELLAKLNLVAGVYDEKSPVFEKIMKANSLLAGKRGIGSYTLVGMKDRGLDKTVLITGCNYGFINHLNNFKCFAERLGMKFLVISMDKLAHSYITHNTTMLSYLMTGGVVGDTSSVPQKFRSKQFNLITARKKEAVHDILALGFNVLFSDTDVAMIRDPLPYMLWKNVDYVHSLNYMCKV